MAAFKLSAEQADLLAEHIAWKFEQATEGCGSAQGVLKATEVVAPFIDLIRSLTERREFEDRVFVAKFAVEWLGHARQSIGSEREGLEHIREGNEDYFFCGGDQAGSEQTAEKQIAECVTEARLWREILDVANGRGAEAVSA